MQSVTMTPGLGILFYCSAMIDHMDLTKQTKYIF